MKTTFMVMACTAIMLMLGFCIYTFDDAASAQAGQAKEAKEGEGEEGSNKETPARLPPSYFYLPQNVRAGMFSDYRVRSTLGVANSEFRLLVLEASEDEATVVFLVEQQTVRVGGVPESHSVEGQVGDELVPTAVAAFRLQKGPTGVWHIMQCFEGDASTEESEGSFTFSDKPDAYHYVWDEVPHVNDQGLYMQFALHPFPHHTILGQPLEEPFFDELCHTDTQYGGYGSFETPPRWMNAKKRRRITIFGSATKWVSTRDGTIGIEIVTIDRTFKGGNEAMALRVVYEDGVEVLNERITPLFPFVMARVRLGNIAIECHIRDGGVDEKMLEGIPLPVPDALPPTDESD